MPLLAGCLPELPQRKNPHLIAPPPPPKGIRAVDHTFALTMIAGRRVSGVRARVIDTGAVRVRGEAVSALKSYHTKLRLAAPAFLIEHPSEGPILFETGLASATGRGRGGALEALDSLNPINPYPLRHEARRGQDVVAQLGRLGIAASDVRKVVLSHLDVEQAGMMAAFPAAEIIVSRREWEWRLGRRAEGKDAHLPDLAALEPRTRLLDIHNAPALGAFDNGVDLLGDGSLFVVSLPGHTPGNIGLWANLDEGPALFTGGAAFVVDNYLDLALPVKHLVEDAEEFWRSLHVIRAMREAVPQLVVFPAHDLTPLTLTRRKDISLVDDKRK